MHTAPTTGPNQTRRPPPLFRTVGLIAEHSAGGGRKVSPVRNKLQLRFFFFPSSQSKGNVRLIISIHYYACYTGCRKGAQPCAKVTSSEQASQFKVSNGLEHDQHVNSPNSV